MLWVLLCSHGRQPIPPRQESDCSSESSNMKRAWKHVKRNKGCAGVDGRSIADTAPLLRDHWQCFRQRLLDGTFQPYPVLRVELEKPDGGVRKLGIPTVLDRVIQQAISQVLTPLFDPDFSASSFGYRPNRSAHDAIRSAHAHMQAGKQWVVDMDLRKFFDTVDHDILMARIGRKVKDKRLKRLINAYLTAGVLSPEGFEPSDIGTPQGGPLSPLLSNILLADLDKELERRGHSFCRYADDCNIYVGSRRAGERVLASITRFCEATLKVQVNRQKSGVGRPWTRQFLGFHFLKVFGKMRIHLPDKSLAKFRWALRAVFKKGRGRNVARFIRERLNPVLRGWLNYFVIGASNHAVATLDFWVRRRLRDLIWRQWKRPRTRMHRLIGLGVPRLKACEALNRRGPWWNAGSPVVTHGLSPAHFQQLGLFCLTDTFKTWRRTST